MTSSIVNFLIEKYLCFFVEIDANEIDASILNGTISLNNLRIKPSFFDSINLPDIEIINGYIGALDIKISLPLFYAQPIKVEINKFFLNVQMKAATSEQEEIARMERIKKNKLNMIEEFSINCEKFMKEAYNKIFLFADIKKEGDEGKFLTLILTDRFFLLTYNMIEEPMMVKVRDVSSCEVHIENDMYSVTFIMTSGRRRGFKLYEQKVACRLYDLFKQITAGNIPIDKSSTIYENEF